MRRPSTTRRIRLISLARVTADLTLEMPCSLVSNTDDPAASDLSLRRDPPQRPLCILPPIQRGSRALAYGFLTGTMISTVIAWVAFAW